jgi:chromate reductase, NAD(P)H dehydrogenase (quinone)
VQVSTLCGSLAEHSANAAALAAVEDRLRSQHVSVLRVTGLESIQAFRPELVDSPSTEVANFRSALGSDAVIIAAPEYAAGVAGVVKNSLDWCVGSATLNRKVVAVISAGTTGGSFAIEQLVRTLSWHGALTVATVSIANPKSKLNGVGMYSDHVTLDALRELADTVVAATRAVEPMLLEMIGPVVARYGIDASRFGLGE